MFQDFAKRKLNDYLGLLEFPDDKISFEQLRHSPLPSFIINFVEFYIPDRRTKFDKTDFEEILLKALIFNINYIIRPKYSIIKFLFGGVETRPVEFIKERLKYFQFYGYYIKHIVEFIDMNSLEVVSLNQIEHIIDEVNRKIYDEISEKAGTDSHRLNLIKLLYYFFHDLGDNNPINIKLPKKILSVFFADKGFIEIKKRIDGFFSEEVFIQEALELMNPKTKKPGRPRKKVLSEDERVNEIITRSVSGLIDKELSNKEVEKILKADEQVPEEPKPVNISEIRDRSSKLPDMDQKKLVIDENIYSDDLVFVSQFNNMAPPAQISDEEKRENLIKDIFCEETYRKKIIKKVFSNREISFRLFVDDLLKNEKWNDAAIQIEKYFNDKKIDYYSPEAVKFVDLLQSHYIKDSDSNDNNKAV
jgi:hypothetical protein